MAGANVLASMMQPPPGPKAFDGTQWQSDRNALAQQVAQTGLTQQQAALERQRVAREKQEAEARARELRDQQILTEGMRAVYGSPTQSAGREAAYPDPGLSGTRPTPAPIAVPPVNNLATPGPAPLPAQPQRDEANLTPDQATGREPSPNALANPMVAPSPAPQPMSLPPAQTAPKAGVPAPPNVSPQEANAALEQYAIKNGISAPGLANWRAFNNKTLSEVAKLTQEQAAIEAEKHGRVAEILDGAKRAAPELWPQAVVLAQRIEPGLQLPTERPNDAQLDFLIAGLGHYAKQLANTEAAAKPALTKAQTDEAKARAKALEANATQTARASMAGPLAVAADSGDPDAYAAAYHRLSPSEQASGEWPTPEEYDPETSGDRIRAAASPIKEQIRSAQFEERESRLKEHSSDMKDRWKGMEDAAKERNRIAAAKAGSPTGNAAGIANRFDRRMAADLDKQEARLHSQLFDLGTIIGTKSVTNPTTGQAQPVTDLTYYQGKMAAAQDRLQTIQFNKATLLGLGIPDKKAVVAIPEGSQIAAPDGSIWQKRDGVAYWESGKGKPPAPAAPASPVPAAQAQPSASGLQPGAQNPFGMAAPVGAKPSSTPPPANVAAGTPEGHTATGPDGVVWKKVKGRMVRQ